MPSAMTVLWEIVLFPREFSHEIILFHKARLSKLFNMFIVELAIGFCDLRVTFMQLFHFAFKKACSTVVWNKQTKLCKQEILFI